MGELVGTFSEFGSVGASVGGPMGVAVGATVVGSSFPPGVGAADVMASPGVLLASTFSPGVGKAVCALVMLVNAPSAKMMDIFMMIPDRSMNKTLGSSLYADPLSALSSTNGGILILWCHFFSNEPPTKK
jgi:hypothetical protein